MNTTTTDRDAAAMLNILTALTVIVPVGISADEMAEDDKADAIDAWHWHFKPKTPGTVLYPGDGRALRYW